MVYASDIRGHNLTGLRIQAIPGGGREEVTGSADTSPGSRPQSAGAIGTDHLAVALVPETYDEPPWRPEAGPTAFDPHLRDIDYLGGAEHVWMAV